MPHLPGLLHYYFLKALVAQLKAECHALADGNTNVGFRKRPYTPDTDDSESRMGNVEFHVFQDMQGLHTVHIFDHRPCVQLMLNPVMSQSVWQCLRLLVQDQ